MKLKYERMHLLAMENFALSQQVMNLTIQFSNAEIVTVIFALFFCQNM